jgi:hypothetical protein
VGAVPADAQVRPAFHAGFTPARLAGQGPFLAAVVTMTGHSDFGFAIFDLVTRKLYPRKSKMESGGLPGRSSKFYS